MNNILKSLWLAFRPKTLTAAVVPIFVGTALAYSLEKNYSMDVAILTLAASVFIQIATNLFNDAIDFKKGADNENRIGPQRVTQSGLMKVAHVYLAAGGFLAMALVCGIPLVIRGGEIILVIGVVSFFLAYAYTGGPIPLAYKGLGEIFVILFFGIIAVAGVFYLHTLHFHWASVIAGIQIGFLATILLAINNMRDMNEDKKVNKKTLAVRFGIKFARWEIVFLLLASFLLGLYWVAIGKVFAALLPLVLWPVVRRLLKSILEESPSPKFNVFLAQSALIHLVFGIQLSIGLLL